MDYKQFSKCPKCFSDLNFEPSLWVVCNICQNFYYCSNACLHADRKNHSKECKKILKSLSLIKQKLNKLDFVLENFKNFMITRITSVGMKFPLFKNFVSTNEKIKTLDSIDLFNIKTYYINDFTSTIINLESLFTLNLNSPFLLWNMLLCGKSHFFTWCFWNIIRNTLVNSNTLQFNENVIDKFGIVISSIHPDRELSEFVADPSLKSSFFIPASSKIISFYYCYNNIEYRLVINPYNSYFYHNLKDLEAILDISLFDPQDRETVPFHFVEKQKLFTPEVIISDIYYDNIIDIDEICNKFCEQEGKEFLRSVSFITNSFTEFIVDKYKYK